MVVEDLEAGYYTGFVKMKNGDVYTFGDGT